MRNLNYILFFSGQQYFLYFFNKYFVVWKKINKFAENYNDRHGRIHRISTKIPSDDL